MCQAQFNRLTGLKLGAKEHVVLAELQLKRRLMGALHCAFPLRQPCLLLLFAKIFCWLLHACLFDLPKHNLTTISGAASSEDEHVACWGSAQVTTIMNKFLSLCLIHPLKLMAQLRVRMVSRTRQSYFGVRTLAIYTIQ